jgi:hypothetical protein
MMYYLRAETIQLLKMLAYLPLAAENFLAPLAKLYEMFVDGGVSLL